MPGKSKHKRSKRYQPPSKKGKSRRNIEAPIVQQSAIAESESVPQPSKPAPGVRVSSPPAKAAIARYPFIATELRTIGILAGVIIVILIVLFFALR